jgi:hypothetical protein
MDSDRHRQLLGHTDDCQPRHRRRQSRHRKHLLVDLDLQQVPQANASLKPTTTPPPAPATLKLPPTIRQKTCGTPPFPGTSTVARTQPKQQAARADVAPAGSLIRRVPSCRKANLLPSVSPMAGFGADLPSACPSDTYASSAPHSRAAGVPAAVTQKPGCRYLDDGYLCYGIPPFIVHRTRIRSAQRVPAGPAAIEVRTTYTRARNAAR